MSNNKETQNSLLNVNKKLEIITNLLKDLLIIELGQARFNRVAIRGVLGKIDNSRIDRILVTLKKVDEIKIPNRKT